MFVTNIKNIAGFSNPITNYNLDIMQSIVSEKSTSLKLNYYL
jgi:hypothetical protein